MLSCHSEPLLQEDGAAPASVGPGGGQSGDIEHRVSQQHECGGGVRPHHPPPGAELQHPGPHLQHPQAVHSRPAVLLPQVSPRLRGGECQVPDLLQRRQLCGHPAPRGGGGHGGGRHAPGGRHPRPGPVQQQDHAPGRGQGGQHHVLVTYNSDILRLLDKAHRDFIVLKSVLYGYTKIYYLVRNIISFFTEIGSPLHQKVPICVFHITHNRSHHHGLFVKQNCNHSNTEPSANINHTKICF